MECLDRKKGQGRQIWEGEEPEVKGHALYDVFLWPALRGRVKWDREEVEIKHYHDAEETGKGKLPNIEHGSPK
jgi:hypothetical protein